jgi:hypothetical protein
MRSSRVWMRSSGLWMRPIAEWSERRTVNATVATSVQLPHPPYTVESEGRQMKQR